MDRVIQGSESEFLALVREAIREELKSFKPASNEIKPPATKKETAAFLGVSITTLESLMASNQVAFFKIGRQVRFKWDDIHAYVAKKAR